MERQKSLETRLLRKTLSYVNGRNLSIRTLSPKEEKKLQNDDVLLETGLSKRSPIKKERKKLQNDDDDCRVTAVVLLSTFISVSGSFSSGLGVGYSSAAQFGIMRDIGLSVAEYSMFGSIMTFGGIIGAVFSGKIADILGRKRAMLLAEIFCGFGWLSIALAQDTLWLDGGRLLLGIGVGLFSYVIPIYIAEITPKHVRGSFVFANQFMQNCGISLFFIIGNFVPWRTLSIIGLVPCIFHIFGLFFIPESPRWLIKFGRDKECRIALQRLRGQGVDISNEADAIKETSDLYEKGGSESRMTDLFQKRYAYSLIIGIGLMFLQQLSGSSGVTYYASSLFERGGFSSTIGTSILAMIMVPKAMMGMIIVDKMGRRLLLMSSAAGMCFFGLLLSVSFLFQSLGVLDELTPIFTCIGVLGHIVTFAMGMGGLPWIIMSEIFPMNVKVSAGTLVTLTNWSFGWIITYAFNFLLQWNASGTFLIFSVVSAATIAFVYVLVPETKGRTLEEIQASISNFLQ